MCAPLGGNADELSGAAGHFGYPARDRRFVLPGICLAAGSSRPYRAAQEMIRKLLENLPCKFSGGLTPLGNNVLSVEANFFKFLRSGYILRGGRIEIREPFGINVQPAGALSQSPPV